MFESPISFTIILNIPATGKVRGSSVGGPDRSGSTLIRRCRRTPNAEVSETLGGNQAC